MTDRITIQAHGKVNLLLRVLGREESGYHDIETVFCRIALADEITVERHDGPDVALEVDGPDLGAVEDNLATRAARAVLDATGKPFGMRIQITKRIPVAAGLGGGSADAAAVLQAVNALAGGAVPRHELLQFAARLGADVPFLLSGASLAVAWGRGDRMLALPPLPAAPILLVTPGIAVPTGDAYQWVDRYRADDPRRGALSLDLESLASWGSIGRMAGNDFEAPVFGHHPALREAFEALAGTGPLICRMSGSGSTLFALYRNERDRDDAATRLGRRHGELIPTSTA